MMIFWLCLSIIFYSTLVYRMGIEVERRQWLKRMRQSLFTKKLFRIIIDDNTYELNVVKNVDLNRFMFHQNRTNLD